MLGTVVETKNLVETVVVSLVAGIGFAAAFSILIFGAARFADLRRDDRPMLAVAAGALGAVALAVVLGSIVAGIVVMTKK
jgi:heme A synthase